MLQNNPIREMINAEILRRQVVGIDTDDWCVPPHRFSKPGRRRYIGASQIGGNCERQPWYDFHWTAPNMPQDPRVLRLFDRGHREEPRFAGYLQMINLEVQLVNPATVPSLWHHPESDSYVVIMGDNVSQELASQCLDVTGTFHEWVARSRGIEIPDPYQFGYISFDGHHAGNCDGRARYIPEAEKWGILPDEWVMLEFKTHNAASFNALADSNVANAKQEHYKQVQRYMHNMAFRLCVYMAVNKNDDDIYCEYIPYDAGINMALDMRVRTAIYAEKPPKRVSSSPAWYECKWCAHRPQCHFGAPLAKNCRSCNQSAPVSEGRWHCNRWSRLIPADFEAVGCDWWKQRDD